MKNERGDWKEEVVDRGDYLSRLLLKKVEQNRNIIEFKEGNQEVYGERRIELLTDKLI